VEPRPLSVQSGRTSPTLRAIATQARARGRQLEMTLPRSGSGGGSGLTTQQHAQPSAASAKQSLLPFTLSSRYEAIDSITNAESVANLGDT